jgi:uncharacterized protein YjbJ (UPF0337 family)
VCLLVRHGAYRSLAEGVSRPPGEGIPVTNPDEGSSFVMGILDKITGRTKKAAGDLADDPALRREGRTEERKGEEKEKLADAQDRVEDKAQDVADLERRT